MGLFTPVWMSRDVLKEDKAVKSVMKMSRQDQLSEAAIHAPLLAVRLAAVKKLTDQKALCEVAEAAGEADDADSQDVRRAAEDKISDQVFLKRLALNPRCTGPGIVGKLTDQNLLEKFAREEDWQKAVPGADIMQNRNSEIQCAAIRALKSQDVLKTLFSESADPHVRLAAAERISDASFLRQAAYHDKDPQVRLSAAKKLSLADVISEVSFILQIERLKNVPKEESHKIDRTEIDAISDSSALLDIYLHARSPWIRSAAQDRWLKLQPGQQELVQLFLQNGISVYDKEKIVPMIRKNGLAEILQTMEIHSGEDERTALLVLEQLKSFREILFEIYEDTEKNFFIREEAWKLLVRHHRKYLAEKGLKDEADKTAADQRTSDLAWRKHLDDVSDAMEQHL